MVNVHKKLPDAVSFDVTNNCILIIAQNKLPMELEIKELKTSGEVWHAINHLEVRGAPAIGITAAFGLAMYARQLVTDDWLYFMNELHAVAEYFKTARPTAVNLSAVVDAMVGVLSAHPGEQVSVVKDLLLEEALHQKAFDELTCRQIGVHAVHLIPEAKTVMTYCNAGALAVSGRYGTALSPVYVAQEQGRSLHVIACETRPILQGARLTAFELSTNEIPVTVICDNMAAAVMRDKKPDAVFVGADRIAANGDVANKIGTYGLAILAKAHGIPFYVCAPELTIDRDCVNGGEIPIEQRQADEVRSLWYSTPKVPSAAGIYNSAFDVTPAELITGIITEKGVFKPPYLFS